MEDLLTTKEASKLLKVHQNTVLRWVKTGKLSSIKVGKEYRIPMRAIENKFPKVVQEKTRVIAVANQKGGVAKTTTCVNLATALAEKGQKVLLIDLDPQGGCSVCLGIDAASLNKTVYNVLMSNKTGFKDIILSTDFGFDFAPSNIDLAGAEVELKQLMAAEQVLARNINAVKDNYDFIILDCPPSLGMLTVNALTAAKELLIPMATEVMALRGLEMLIDTVDRVKAVLNPELKILGILATKYDVRTINSREIFGYLEKKCNEAGVKLFNTYIKDSVRLTEAPNQSKPFILINPNHDSAKAYRQIAQEVLGG